MDVFTAHLNGACYSDLWLVINNILSMTDWAFNFVSYRKLVFILPNIFGRFLELH